MDIYLPFDEKRKAMFCQSDWYGHAAPDLPHPIDLNTENSWLSLVRNDLRNQNVGYLIELPNGAELFSPIEGKVIDVRMHPNPDFLSFQEVHQTNLVQIEGKDGIVRLEHLMPGVSVGQSVSPSDVIGSPYGWLGGSHIHLYSVQHPMDTAPRGELRFADLPAGFTHANYDSIELALRINFPDLSGWRERADQFAEAGPMLSDRIFEMAQLTRMLTDEMRESLFGDTTKEQLIRCLRGAGYIKRF